MCKFRSAVAVKDGDDVKLMMLPDCDSHEKIREHFKIRDGLGAGSSRQTPLEYYPTTDLYDYSTYKFEFDAGRPDWWTDEMTESAIRQFQSDIDFLIKSEFDGYGNLDLNGLTSADGLKLPEVGGSIYLSGLTSAKGVTFGKVGGEIYLKNKVIKGK